MYLGAPGLNAQQTAVNNASGKISGRIIDSATGQPVEFASVSLSVQSVDKEINGMMTDEKGAFVLTNIADGTYKLSIFSIGYKQGIKNNIIISKATPNVNIGNIKLATVSSKLADVTVAADKNTVEYKLDKTIYNVDKDITSQTGVATDVLKKIPEISVDVDGNIELQGNSNIRFLIDGKPSTIFGTNLPDVLAAIPASQIQSIEIITSPGAKYDAEGTGGIINIILKKSNVQGINGNVSLSGGTRYENGSFNLNARKGNFGAHVYFGGNAQLASTTLTSVNRTGQDTASTTSQELQNGSSNFKRVGYQAGGGFDWEITPKNNISGGAGYPFFQNNTSGISNRQTLILDPYGNTFSNVNDLISTSGNTHQESTYWYFNYKKTFQKKDEELDLAVNSYTTSNNTYYIQTQEHLANDSVFNSSYGNNPGVYGETDLALDYTDPITKDFSFETGTKVVLNDINSTSDVYLLNPPDDYEYNTSQSSSLNYKSYVYAGYVSATFKIFNWLDVKAGARYEYTEINAYYSSAGDVSINPYGILVPSAVLSHTFKDNQTLKISYTRRIQRPNYYNLNPFINATDPENVTTGNTTLQPEIGDKFELGYNKIFNKGGSIYLSAFCQYNTHDIQPYTTYYPAYKIGDSTYTNVSVTEPENIGSEVSVGPSISGSIPLENKIMLRPYISIYERYINTGFSSGGNISGINYRLNLNGTYEFNKTLTLEVFGNYNSPRINAQGTYPAFFSYNFAIRKKLFNEQASIAITANNPFNYYVNQTANLSGQNFTLINSRDVPYQSFGINFTYKFGKLEFKNEKDQDSNLPPSEN